MVAPLGDGLADSRDRALLLFGFAGALRRSELVALDVEDVSDGCANQNWIWPTFRDSAGPPRRVGPME